MTEDKHHHDHHDHDHDHSHEENDFITLTDDEGNEQLYQILFTFESEDYGKQYVIVYPMGSLDSEDDEEVELFAFSYNESEDGETGTLDPIESEEEWDMIEEVVNTFVNEEDL